MKLCVVFNYALNFIEAKTLDDAMKQADMIALSYKELKSGLNVWRVNRDGLLVSLLACRPAFISGHVLNDCELLFHKYGHLGKWRKY